MMVRNLLLFLFSFFVVLSAFSQGISGRITNTQGEAIPFATIYIPDLSTGTTSNSDGNYELKLPEGSVKYCFSVWATKRKLLNHLLAKAFRK